MTEYKKMSQEKYEAMLAEMRRDGIFTSTKEPSVELTLSELTKIYNVLAFKELLSEDVINMVKNKISKCF